MISAPLRIKKRKVSKLVPYAKNARTHSSEQIAEIVGSINRFGFTTPILIDEKNGIIAGHGKVLAAEQLSMKTVPTITLTGLTEPEKRAYILADNKIAENAGWDPDLLVMELVSLLDDDFDLGVIGFDDDELRDLLGDIDGIDFPSLPDGDRKHFQQITFTVHDDQAEKIKEAIDKAKQDPEHDDEINDNSNGNALAHICGEYLK